MQTTTGPALDTYHESRNLFREKSVASWFLGALHLMRATARILAMRSAYSPWSWGTGLGQTINTHDRHKCCKYAEMGNCPRQRLDLLVGVEQA